MSSTYQSALQQDVVDTELPELFFSESADLGGVLDPQDLDCTDPTLLCFDPFEFHLPAGSELLGSTEANQTQSFPQDVTTDTSALEQLNDLNLLYLQLQARVNELDAHCVKLHNAYVFTVQTRDKLADNVRFRGIESQFWAVETYVKQLGAWYFDLKDAVCANTEKVAREIKSIRTRKSFL
ncbi:hypothetical protein LTR41_010675 [Exophiala xenobiotica]|nr:hypothetical protein LTR41_010675 [Exophiala xenobiotica]